jgi:hypothetical protein
MSKRYSTTLPDGRMAIINLAEGTPAQEARFLQKTLFELNRSTLSNPFLSGEALAEWRLAVHFDDYRGPRVWRARDCTGEALPANRSRRHAWRDNGVKIVDDMTIP